MVNVGIIGAGRIGKVHVESICTQVKDAKVKMLADPFMNDETAKWAKDMVEKVKKEELSFLDGVRMGTFTVPGDGDIDFDPIFKVLEESGYTGYMVVEAEQDPAKANPLEYALKARKFISEKTGL